MVCRAGAVVTVVYLLRCFCSHPWKACAVQIVILAELSISELIALSCQDISRKCLGSSLSVGCDACAVVTDVYILTSFAHMIRSFVLWCL